MKDKFCNRNLVIVILGQFISIFGNSILRFSLPLFILDKTGSTAVFGTVLAVSSIPVILFSPIGGIIADRCNKRSIMVILDFFTAIVIAACTLLLGSNYVLIVISVMMVLLSIIQSLYQPAVQACLPMITNKSNLEKANSSVSFVNAVSSLLGPVAAGILYGTFGIMPITIIGGVCFGAAAFMELFISIRFVCKTSHGSFLKVIGAELKESAVYIIKDNPVLFRIIIIVSCINLTMTSMILVGLPVLIKINLGLSSELYGFTQGIIALGMITGGIITFAIGDKININRIYQLLILMCLTQVPIGLVFTFKSDVMFAYWVISVSSAVLMMLVTVFSIKMMSFVQRNTPVNLIGKVISFILMMTKCTLPIGQATYGYLFNLSINNVSLIIFITVLCSTCIAIYSRKIFSGFMVLEQQEKKEIHFKNQLQKASL